MFDPFAGVKPRTRLFARRRSRCWQCDGQMTKSPGSRSWWCARCAHVVTYLT